MTRDEKWLLEEKYDGNANAEGFMEDKYRLARGEPVAYVIGWQPFLGLKINLDSHPLIPRPETEWWTEQLLTTPNARDATHFLDLCAGSGAIGCVALKMLPKVQVSFGEIDPSHEATILKNIRENVLVSTMKDISERIDIRIGDLFKPFGTMRFDIIAINPPYISTKSTLEASVINFEPHEALFAGDDGLAIIRRVAKELPLHLNSEGVAWIECSDTNARTACKLFETEGMHTELIADQFKVPRVVVVSFP